MASHRNVFGDYEDHTPLGKVVAKCAYCEEKLRYAMDGYTICDWCDAEVHLRSGSDGTRRCSLLTVAYDTELADHLNFRLCMDCYAGDN